MILTTIIAPICDEDERLFMAFFTWHAMKLVHN